jgi:outer membrane receptor protein involved in Fe transport
VAIPALAFAQQQPHPADSARAAQDTLTRPHLMPEITVATTRPERNEPASAVTVTPAVIRRTPAINTFDLLRQTAGLEVHDQGQGPGFASNASLRGFSSDHSTDLALWIDGVPVNEPVNGHAEGYGDWSLLMPQSVRDIEVLKGPTSALFGNFALAGVVNVRTTERMRGTELGASAGAFGRLEGSLLTGLDRAGTGLVVGVRGLHEDGWRPNSGYDLGQGHLRLVQSLSPSATLDAGIELYSSGWSSPGFLSDSLFQRRQWTGVSNVTDGGFKHRAQERVSLRVIAGPAVLWRSTAYATQGRWQLFLTTPPEGGGGEGSGSQTEEEDRRYGFGATSALTWIPPRGEVTAGFEGRLDRADYENWFTTNRRRDSSQTLVVGRQASAGLFVQAQFDFTHHLRARIGGRFDARTTRSTPAGQAGLSRGAGVFVPKFGVLYHLPRLGAAYANVSRGYRQTDGVIEDPTLPFITAWAYEGGLKVDHGDLSGSIALFRMDVSNEQTFDPITLRSASGGASRRQGVEIGAAVQVAPFLTLSADWTFNDARYTQLITADGDTLSGARVYNTSEYVGVVAATFAPPAGAWTARIGANVVGPYSPFDEPGVELAAFGLLHASASYSLGPKRSVNVGVRNLLDRAYPELRAGGFVVPGQPRTLVASVTIAP